VHGSRFWIIPAASSPAKTTATNRTRPITVRMPSPSPPFEIALREEVRLEPRVELNVGGVDHRPRAGCGRLDHEMVRHRDLADRPDVALREPLLGLRPVFVELQSPRDEVVLAEPQHDPLVADVLALGGELDHVRPDAVHRLLAAQARGGVVLRPRAHLLDEVEVMVGQVRPDEALGPRARRDLAHPLELGQVEPLIGRPPLVRVGEERGALHLGRREEEENCLLLVAGLVAIVELELAHALAPPAADPEGELLVAVGPVARGVVERLSAVEDLPCALLRPKPARADRRGYHDGKGSGGHARRLHSRAPCERKRTPRQARRRRAAASSVRCPGSSAAGGAASANQARPRYMYCRPETAVSAPVT